MKTLIDRKHALFKIFKHKRQMMLIEIVQTQAEPEAIDQASVFAFNEQIFAEKSSPLCYLLQYLFSLEC